jgi:Ser/Thr protein kinase RdoA (MazF antagonist)
VNKAKSDESACIRREWLFCHMAVENLGKLSVSEFYQSTSEQQAARIESLAQRAVGEWGIDNADLALLKYRENAVYAVTTDTGERYALRVHRHNYHTDDELVSELTWMKALNTSGIHTPAVVPALDNSLFKVVQSDSVPEPRQCDLLSWIDGEQLGSIEQGVAGNDDSMLRSYRQVGELAARVHNQAAEWKLPDSFTRHAWNLEGLVGENPVWGRFWELPVLSPEQQELILRARELVRTRLNDFGSGSDRYSLIHADLIPENLMLSGETIMLIDFDDSGFGWHLFELATTLFFVMDDDRADEITDATLQGYRKHRALSDEHLEMLPIFFLARGLTYLGWAHTRSEMEAAQLMTSFIVEVVCELAERILLE